MRHTYRSEVNIRKLPVRTEGLAAGPSAARFIEVMVKNAQGELIESAIPKFSIIKDASYSEDDYDGDPAQEVDVIALVEYKLKSTPLAGFVLEGLSPYGRPASTSRTRAMMRAAYTGFPVVMVGRGTPKASRRGSRHSLAAPILPRPRHASCLCFASLNLACCPRRAIRQSQRGRKSRRWQSGSRITNPSLIRTDDIPCVLPVCTPT